MSDTTESNASDSYETYLDKIARRKDAISVQEYFLKATAQKRRSSSSQNDDLDEDAADHSSDDVDEMIDTMSLQTNLVQSLGNIFGKSGILAELGLGSILSSASTAATPADNSPSLSAPFSMLDEFTHKAQVFGHGVQTGIVDMLAAPEGLYDMVDQWTGGWLPGDEKANSTESALTDFADNNLIRKTELRDDWDKGLDFAGQLSSWVIPIGGTLKAVGAATKIVKAAETLQDVREIASVGQIFTPS